VVSTVRGIVSVGEEAPASDSQYQEQVNSQWVRLPNVQWGMKNPSNFLLRISDKVEMNIRVVGRLR